MPLQHLFTKREQRIVAGISKEEAVQRSASYWSSNGFRVNFLGPYQMHAEHIESRLGLRQALDLYISDYGKDVAIDLSLSATLGDTEAVVGAVGLLIIPLAAVVVGGISYLEYDERANKAIQNYWASIYSAPGAGGAQPQQVIPSKCKSCGADLDRDSLYCRHCGAKVS